jgi:hypothetical protein
VRLAGGFIGGIDFGTRVQAADLLKFCVARVRLSAARPGDRPLLQSIPRLVGELRAAMKPLVFTLHTFVEEGDSVVSSKEAEDAVNLLRVASPECYGGSQRQCALVTRQQTTTRRTRVHGCPVHLAW